MVDPIPPSYIGREQTWLKHLVLDQYLEAWAHKLGSASRFTPTRLWYVDCFAGPWESTDTAREDTSIAIGLRALERATETWAREGYRIEAHAVFVEKDRRSSASLREFLSRRKTSVNCHQLDGEFGSRVPEIQGLIRSDAAFLFVDPTGWKGAAMRFIRPLVAQARRDVLVNVMMNDIRRFQDDPRAFIRTQLKEFFGLSSTNLPLRLTEEELIELYRGQLQSQCQLRYAADLVVPHPVSDRTKFRLVVGGQHPEVLRVFRDAEARVFGRYAPVVRSAARERDRAERTGQPSLPGMGASQSGDIYQDLRNEAVPRARVALLESVSAGNNRFCDIWPVVLQSCHMTFSDVARLGVEMVRAGELSSPAVGHRRQMLRDSDILNIPAIRRS